MTSLQGWKLQFSQCHCWTLLQCSLSMYNWDHYRVQITLFQFTIIAIRLVQIVKMLSFLRSPSLTLRYLTWFEHKQTGTQSDVQILQLLGMSRDVQDLSCTLIEVQEKSQPERQVLSRCSGTHTIVHYQRRSNCSLAWCLYVKPVLHIHRHPKGILVRCPNIKHVLYVHETCKSGPGLMDV